jgi:DNA modification methylase
MSPSEFTAFQRSIFRNCVRFSKDGSIHFQCMDHRHIREILDAADGVYTEFKQLVVWDKGSGGQGTFYRSQYELIFVFKSGRARHTNNFQLGQTGRYRTNVWKYNGVNTMGKGRADEMAAHATPKSIPMVMDAIRDCSNRGELILDPCLGSGVTLIAAHKTGRIGVGIEIDPLYVDVALKRLAAVTGIDPILDGDGRTFSEINTARHSEREG